MGCVQTLSKIECRTNSSDKIDSKGLLVTTSINYWKVNPADKAFALTLEKEIGAKIM